MYGEKYQELGRPSWFRQRPVRLTNRKRGRLKTSREWINSQYSEVGRAGYMGKGLTRVCSL
ncbi:hypothetical protein E4K67_21135 [Desulfosporosinus fructosivorans]|uniref:Uncharacterized protein n=1 Tax=Desulfosporosinus fructosivorans TaxID=2018669 RepID=A0A4Z0R224_9FIRM|nr:hypothetical protein E4K67_21135 [Desulfosporosinus fructosivorans]